MTKPRFFVSIWVDGKWVRDHCDTSRATNTRAFHDIVRSYIDDPAACIMLQADGRILAAKYAGTVSAVTLHGAYYRATREL